MPIEFFSAVLVNSADPERLATFYRDVLEVPLETEEHGAGPKHYGCELGDIHFAIHPLRSGISAGSGAVDLSFQVFALDELLERLAKGGVKPLFPPGERGFARMTAVKDPDGNTVYLTQLTDRWLEGIESRRQKGSDLIQRWKGHSKGSRA